MLRSIRSVNAQETSTVPTEDEYAAAEEQAARLRYRLLTARPAPVQAPTAPQRKLVGKVELASLLGISGPTLLKRIKSGEIPCLRVGDTCRFDVDQVMAALGRAGEVE